jgi:hypothetical protein
MMTLTRKKGLTRSSFKRKEPKPFALPDRQTFERNQEAKKRVGLKRKAKRATVAEGSKYLAACRGERCFLRLPGVCTGWLYQNETVVPCHSNQARHGKGMGIKANHMYTVPGCATCHWWIDQSDMPREKKFAYWDAAYAEWEPVRARKMGIEIQQLEAA